MNKPNLITDFDGCLVDTISSFCKCYDYYYHTKEGYKPANPNLVNTWNFTDQCPLIPYDEVEEMFNREYMFRAMKPMPNAFTVLEELTQKYNVIICTIGSLDNLRLKAQYIQSNLPFIKNTILLNNDGLVMNKSIINMDKSIFIDDHIGNLISSNAKLKICYGKEYIWNQDWDGIRFTDWLSLKDYLMNIDVSEL